MSLKLYKHPARVTWKCMMGRCRDKNNNSYDDYGARGITVCREWQKAKNFVLWAEKNGYRKGLQIDRKNNDIGYTPENCRFVTSKENNQHRRNSKHWYFLGKRFTSLSDAAAKFSVSITTVYVWCRNNKNGCYLEERKIKCQ